MRALSDTVVTPLSRRSLLAGGLALGAVGLTAPHAVAAPSRVAGTPDAQSSVAPVTAARDFLRSVTDAYTASGPRLAQSYQDASGLVDTGFVYDNALTLLALLATGDVGRARAIGDGFLLAQAADEAGDGRVRQAYHAGNLVDGRWQPVAGWEWGFTGSAVGDLSWTGIALTQLASMTGVRKYLDGALALADWIVANTWSTTGLQGYTFGATAGLEDHKSTEHNIDVYAFFGLLAKASGDRVRWRKAADHAWAFVERMWNADGGFFWTGSDDGAAINTNPLQRPLDCQTWSWLAARDRRYGGALDWATGTLWTIDTADSPNSALPEGVALAGVGFATGTKLADPTQPVGGQSWNPLPDPDGVWLEGTGQLALALTNRAQAATRARALKGQLRLAQCGVGAANLGAGQTYNGQALTGGLVAASSPIDTGFGFAYNPNLHTAATSWFVFAETGTNPYRRF